jgi:hypothetical protein
LLSIDPSAATDPDIEVGDWLAREIEKRVGSGRLLIEQDRGPGTLMRAGFCRSYAAALRIRDFGDMRLSKAGKLQPGGLHNATIDHDTLP